MGMTKKGKGGGLQGCGGCCLGEGQGFQNSLLADAEAGLLCEIQPQTFVQRGICEIGVVRLCILVSKCYFFISVTFCNFIFSYLKLLVI